MASYKGLNWQRRNLPLADMAAANARLREHEVTSNLEPSGTVPVVRVDRLRLEALDPCEDNFTFETHDLGGGRVWQFWGVFDGHAGWMCSMVLSQSLSSYVARELKEVFARAGDTIAAAAAAADDDDDKAIEAAIKGGFTRLDDDLIRDGLDAVKNADAESSRFSVIQAVAPAVSGSMAVLALYDPEPAVLRVASVGDSRAVLGRARSLSSTPTGQINAPGGSVWEPLELSQPTTPDRPDERARVLAEHPDEAEDELIAKGRLLGIPTTRAFGDARWKWPTEWTEAANRRFYAPPAKPGTKTPPYLTAEPEVTTTRIAPGDFAVLASDGLWDTVSPAAAVQAMELWLRKHQTPGRTQEPDPGPGPGPALPSAPSDPLPGLEEVDSQVGWTWGWHARPQAMVVEDANAATHLVRNALAGRRRDQFVTIMSMQPPYRHDAHDDMTVQVIFFGSVGAL